MEADDVSPWKWHTISAHLRAQAAGFGVGAAAKGLHLGWMKNGWTSDAADSGCERGNMVNPKTA